MRSSASRSPNFMSVIWSRRCEISSKRFTPLTTSRKTSVISAGAAALRLRLQLLHGQQLGPRGPDVAQQVGEDLRVRHHLDDAGLGLELLLGQAGQVAGHARLQAAVVLAQPALRLLEQDRVHLEEDVRGQAVALVGGEEGVEVELGDAQLGEGEAVLDDGVHEGDVLARPGQEGGARAGRPAPPCAAPPGPAACRRTRAAGAAST